MKQASSELPLLLFLLIIDVHSTIGDNTAWSAQAGGGNRIRKTSSLVSYYNMPQESLQVGVFCITGAL